MSSIRRPVGPQPPAVYWRRRLLVLLGILAVVVVIVLIVVRPGAGEGEPAPTPADTPSNTPAAQDPSDTCDPAVIRIEPVTDAASYPSGVQPQISMTITNTGSRACTYDVGPGQQEYVIMSGSDLIWRSSDCLDGDSFERVLEPGVAESTTPFAWDRTRSAPDTCSTTRPEVIAGGATYRLSVQLGDIESESDVPFLLY